MDNRRFDAITQSLAGALSRRTLLQFVSALVLGAIPTRAVRAVAQSEGASTCKPARKRCTRGNQCCSGVCKKKRRKGRKRRKKKGTCTSLGPFAANCPPVTTCVIGADAPDCQVGDVEGKCTVTDAGEPFCLRTALCLLNEPICQTNEDCFDDYGPDAKCLPCPSETGCPTNVICAVYAGDPPPG
jgi:hypothetical protein